MSFPSGAGTAADEGSGPLPVNAQTTWRRIAIRLRRSLLFAAPTILAIAVADFFLLKAAPGDAADALAAQSGAATEASMTAWRHHFGLDQSIFFQLCAYLNSLLHLNLGVSPLYNIPVVQLIMERLPDELLLMASAMMLAVVAGIIVGTVMAATAGQFTDRMLNLVVLLLYSVPEFGVGLALIILFALYLPWLPSVGARTPGANAGGWQGMLDLLRHLILPTLALASYYFAIYARFVRAAMLEAWQADFVRTAVAKGLRPRTIITRHIQRNALLPLTTMLGVHIGTILGGSIVVESVFSWPGLGRLAFESVQGRDFSVLRGILLFSSLLVMLVNVGVDILQGILDPRIESGREGSP
jgi:peptide/nickel transport system permease protein